VDECDAEWVQRPLGVPLNREIDMTVEMENDVAVVLSAEAFAQLFGYAYATPQEISCLGVVKRKGSIFRIDRFHLAEQEGGCAHTEIKPESIAKLIEKLVAEGKREEAASIKAWAHSHPGMKCFWSKTDDETCRRLVSDYLISIVVSSGYEVRCRIDLGGILPLVLDNIPVFYEPSAEAHVFERYAREVFERVKSPVPQMRNWGEPEFVPVADQFPADEVTYCEYCGNWHSADYCPFLQDDETRFLEF